MRCAVPIWSAVLLASCAAGEPPDYVLYKPPPAVVDGHLVSRMLLVTPAEGALAVSRVLRGEVRLGVGAVSAERWSSLRTRLSRMRYLAAEAQSPREDPETFQIFAHLGEITVDLTRDPEAAVEAEVEGVREDLEELLDGLPVPGDPVAALDPFLASPLAAVRGQAVIALLMLEKDETRPGGVRKAASRRLLAHLRDEEDPEILERLRNH